MYRSVRVRFRCRLRFCKKAWFRLELGFGFRMRVSITVRGRVTVLCEW